jgi:hypothetical protein
MVSFTPRPLYPQGKSCWYPLDRRLGGPQSRFDAVMEREIPNPCRESNPPTIYPVVQRYTSELFQLSMSHVSRKTGFWMSRYNLTFRSVFICFVTTVHMNPVTGKLQLGPIIVIIVVIIIIIVVVVVVVKFITVCGWRRRPPSMDSIYEYTKQSVMESRQGVVLQLVVLNERLTAIHRKKNLL